MKQFEEKIEVLRGLLSGGSKNIAIVSHTNPDGDAVGSSIAWCRVLRGLGHRAECLVPNRYPYFLDWMEGISEVVVFKEDSAKAEKIVSEADLIFCLDFNNIDRLEALSAAITANETAKRILIDHHLDPPNDFRLSFSDTLSCSTAYLVYRIIERVAGLEAIDKAVADGLYVGIMTDTGNFSFSNLTPDLFRAVAVLLEKGVNVPEVNSAVYNSYTEGRVRLLGSVLMEKMKIIHDGEAAYISLKERELRRFNFQLGDSEGFVNYPLSITGVKMSAMFLETRKFIRISLRSRGGVDVSEFAAKYFDGGGHKNAAGGKSFESMDSTVKKYEMAVEEFLGIEKI
jgi:phosphoesterase RecJ-like protein